MNAVELITKTKITAEKVSELLVSGFKYSKKTSQNDDAELFIGKIPNNFYIVFADSVSLDDPRCILDPEIRMAIPFKEGQINCLYFHDVEIAKYAVGVIAKVYDDLFVFDENDFVGTAKEYIESH